MYDYFLDTRTILTIEITVLNCVKIMSQNLVLLLAIPHQSLYFQIIQRIKPSSYTMTVTITAWFCTLHAGQLRKLSKGVWKQTWKC
jgi:urea transporter